MDSFLPRAGLEVCGHRLIDADRRLRNAHGIEDVRKHRVELQLDNLGMACRVLREEPQDPVPEVVVDGRQGLHAHRPWLLSLVGPTEQEVDLLRPSKTSMYVRCLLNRSHC